MNLLDENQYNMWTGSSGEAIYGRKFHAIFDDQDAAIILRIENVRRDELYDGGVNYLAGGEIYYKMFRLYVLN